VVLSSITFTPSKKSTRGLKVRVPDGNYESNQKIYLTIHCISSFLVKLNKAFSFFSLVSIKLYEKIASRSKK
jgi:hypothetical protein